MLHHLHNNALTRLALAALLAATVWPSFAETSTAARRPGSAQERPSPGGMAAAKSLSRTHSPALAPRSPSMPAPVVVNTPPPVPAAATVALDGRLKPTIINPADNMQGAPDAPFSPEMYSRQTRPSSRGAGYLPQMPRPAPASSANITPNPVQKDPFAPSPAPSALLETPAENPGVGQMRGRESALLAAANKTSNVKKTEPEGPSINLDCTTKEIKQQGALVGKIQNRYVYKYKSQYCFDLEP